MKKFLIPLFAGLFVISLLFAPMVALAADDPVITPTGSCTTRSVVSGTELTKLTGETITAPIPAGTPLPGTYTGGIKASFGIICAYSLIEWATNIAFLVIAALSVLVIVAAAFMYLTAAGNPEGTKKAKNFLLYAVIGIVIAILARIIPNIIIQFLG